MNQLPLYISVIFGLTTFLTVFLYFKASNNSTFSLVVLLIWLFLQMFISRTGFYTDTTSFPPKFLLLVIPPFIFIIFLFVTKRGRLYLDGLDLKALTLLHSIRFLVELVLLLLFLNKAVPKLMTFEGRNFDILAGISAPIVYLLAFRKNQINRKVLLFWNIICLGLLVNIVINAVLSAPFPFQRFGFDQPNIAVLHFPFVWLPSCIVPLVLLSHLTAIRKIVKNGS